MLVSWCVEGVGSCEVPAEGKLFTVGVCHSPESLHLDHLSPLLLSCCASQLGKESALKLGSIRYFVLDECDKMLEKLGEKGVPCAPGAEQCGPQTPCMEAMYCRLWLVLVMRNRLL